MTLTQRLAPMLQWAAECIRNKSLREARDLTIVYGVIVADKTPAIEVLAWAVRYLREFGGDSSRGWAYAIAYVLLTEETGQ